LCHQQTNFCCRCSAIDLHNKIDLNTCKDFIVWLCNMWNTCLWIWVCLKYIWWWVIWLPNANVLIMIIDMFRWCDQDWTCDRARTPAGGTGKWFPHFSCIMLMFWNDLLMDDMMKCWLNSWWMLKRWWNVDWILDEWWNDDEMLTELLMNVEKTMKCWLC
jgi:hypothetical protein